MPPDKFGVSFSRCTKRTDVFPSDDFAEFVVVNNHLTIRVTLKSVRGSDSRLLKEVGNLAFNFLNFDNLELLFIR